MMRGSRLRQIGWAMALGICILAFAALTFQVNTVKSAVRLAERQIIELEREKILLETEFQTRANQQQLADWNRIEFGYGAPEAGQYLENERQLADLGMPRQAGAPDPIRVARATEERDSGIPSLLSPVTGQSAQAEYHEEADTDNGADTDSEGGAGVRRKTMAATRSLAERLADDNPLGTPMARVSE